MDLVKDSRAIIMSVQDASAAVVDTKQENNASKDDRRNATIPLPPFATRPQFTQYKVDTSHRYFASKLKMNSNPLSNVIKKLLAKGEPQDPSAKPEKQSSQSPSVKLTVDNMADLVLAQMQNNFARAGDLQWVSEETVLAKRQSIAARVKRNHAYMEEIFGNDVASLKAQKVDHDPAFMSKTLDLLESQIRDNKTDINNLKAKNKSRIQSFHQDSTDFETALQDRSDLNSKDVKTSLVLDVNSYPKFELKKRESFVNLDPPKLDDDTTIVGLKALLS